MSIFSVLKNLKLANTFQLYSSVYLDIISYRLDISYKQGRWLVCIKSNLFSQVTHNTAIKYSNRCVSIKSEETKVYAYKYL